MVMNDVYFGGAFFQSNERNSDVTYVDVILYDSAPVVSTLTPVVNGTIVFTGAPLARVVRLYNLHVTKDAVIVRCTKLVDNTVGFVDPVKVVAAPFMSLKTLRFRDQISAGNFLYTECIGFFVATLVRKGTIPISVPQFSGTWGAFIITALSPALTVSMLPGALVPFIPQQISGNANEDGRLITMFSTIINANVNNDFATTAAQALAIVNNSPVPYYNPLV